MKIEKAINNNVVSARDENGREVVVMGKGIGFQVIYGKEIKEDLIEKVFYMENQNAVDRFKELLAKMPTEHIRVSNDIITYAKQVLTTKLNENIYITLTDHIDFAVERYKNGMMFENPLIWEIQTFYRREYLIGEYAVQLINQELGILFPVDEAASIALHIVNAEYNAVMGDTMNITKMIPAILAIVKKYFTVEIDESTLHYERFITHLKFLAQRVVKKEMLDSKDTKFKDAIADSYPEEYKCSEEIAEYILDTYGNNISGEELSYLAVHIKRVISKEK